MNFCSCVCMFLRSIDPFSISDLSVCVCVCVCGGPMAFRSDGPVDGVVITPRGILSREVDNPGRSHSTSESPRVLALPTRRRLGEEPDMVIFIKGVPREEDG